VQGCQPETAVVIAVHDAELRFAQSLRILQHGLKHRLKIARRIGDDLEHISRGGLLLQRLTQFVEQAGVLDCDDGLRGEVLQ
jgi:translation initiation factor IF-3